MGILAIDLLGDRLVDTDGQDHLLVVVAELHLIEQPRGTREGLVLQTLGCEVVGGQRELLVLIIAIIVVIGQIGLLLGGYHFPHQLDGGVVLPAIATLLGFDGHLGQLFTVGAQGDREGVLRQIVDGELERLIAHIADGKLPTLFAGDGEFSVDIGDDGQVVILIHHTGIGQRLTRLCINNGACELLGGQLQAGHQEG